MSTALICSTWPTPAAAAAYLQSISRDRQKLHTAMAHPIFLYQVRHKGTRCWITDRVFATSEECEIYAESNEHNYPAGRWQCYAVAAHGALRDLLKTAVGP